LREIRESLREIVARVFNRLLRFQCRALVLTEPIDLFADPRQLARSNRQPIEQPDCVRSCGIAVLIDGFG
jgi:hypothetical protein